MAVTVNEKKEKENHNRVFSAVYFIFGFVLFLMARLDQPLTECLTYLNM